MPLETESTLTVERVRAGKGWDVEKCDSSGFVVGVQPESRSK